MAKIVNMFSYLDEDMKDYHKKLWRHRVWVFLRYIGAVCLLVLLIAALRYYFNNRSFSGYSIAQTTERSDTITTKYALFGDHILKYSRDGVSYTDEKNSLFFSITYTMQDPMLALSEQAGAVADKNGNQIFLFDRKQQLGQITTLLPIRDLAISNQGMVAVLLEESDSVRLELYSSDGTLIGDGVFDLQDAGYPMSLCISPDGTKVAIAFAQVAGAKLDSCVAVYNFDRVGENYVDHLVFAKTYGEYMIPELHYFNDQVLAAVGDGILAFYQGSQIPELVKEVTFEDEIQSVFYGESSVGLVFGGLNESTLKLFDLKGNLISEVSFDLDYDRIRIAEHGIIVYSDTEMGLYSYSGKECFRQTFDSSVVEIFPTNFRSKYLFIYTNETQIIKLQ